jgi:hypothetical protein
MCTPAQNGASSLHLSFSISAPETIHLIIIILHVLLCFKIHRLEIFVLFYKSRHTQSLVSDINCLLELMTSLATLVSNHGYMPISHNALVNLSTHSWPFKYVKVSALNSFVSRLHIGGELIDSPISKSSTATFSDHTSILPPLSHATSTISALNS